MLAPPTDASFRKMLKMSWKCLRVGFGSVAKKNPKVVEKKRFARCSGVRIFSSPFCSFKLNFKTSAQHLGGLPKNTLVHKIIGMIQHRSTN